MPTAKIGSGAPWWRSRTGEVARQQVGIGRLDPESSLVGDLICRGEGEMADRKERQYMAARGGGIGRRVAAGKVDRCGGMRWSASAEARCAEVADARWGGGDRR